MADGSFDKEKARLTIRGCFQVAGRDYNDTFAPTAKATTGRVLDAISVLRGWDIDQADITNAFCQADIDMDVYIDLSRGISIYDKSADEDNRRCTLRRRGLRLRRALYGLRQSPRLFYNDLKRSLEEAGLTQCKYDPCLFQSFSDEGKAFYVLCYVDDLKCTGNDTEKKKCLEKVLKL